MKSNVFGTRCVSMKDARMMRKSSWDKGLGSTCIKEHMAHSYTQPCRVGIVPCLHQAIKQRAKIFPLKDNSYSCITQKQQSNELPVDKASSITGKQVVQRLSGVA